MYSLCIKEVVKRFRDLHSFDFDFVNVFVFGSDSV